MGLATSLCLRRLIWEEIQRKCLATDVQCRISLKKDYEYSSRSNNGWLKRIQTPRPRSFQEISDEFVKFVIIWSQWWFFLSKSVEFFTRNSFHLVRSSTFSISSVFWSDWRGMYDVNGKGCKKTRTAISMKQLSKTRCHSYATHHRTTFYVLEYEN